MLRDGKGYQRPVPPPRECLQLKGHRGEKALWNSCVGCHVAKVRVQSNIDPKDMEKDVWLSGGHLHMWTGWACQQLTGARKVAGALQRGQMAQLWLWICVLKGEACCMRQSIYQILPYLLYFQACKVLKVCFSSLFLCYSFCCLDEINFLLASPVLFLRCICTLVGPAHIKGC